MANTLYFGDNLEILRTKIANDSIDLVYLDPPFNSRRIYNLDYKNRYGVDVTIQKEVFEDTWRWDETAQAAYQDLIRQGRQGIIELIQYLLHIDRTQNQSAPAYIVFMAARLIELHRVLKPTGSLYLHCDPTMSHYLKIVLDAIFGRQNFLNEIIWAYKERELAKRWWNRKHDVILFYVKDIESGYSFNYDAVLEPYSKVTRKKFKYKDEKGYYQIRGKGVVGSPVYKADGLRPEHEKIYPDLTYRQYLGKGVLPRDWWTISIINKAAKERLGYPTQKPEALLERIILASSNENDVVLDPFCGCGTTIAVAHRLNRQWLGIDVTHVSIQLIEKRLQDSFPGITYTVHGIPRDFDSAQNLAQRDRYAFEDWALSMINAVPSQGKRGADRGIDGLMFFAIDQKQVGKIIVQVKSGKVGVRDIRDLVGTVEREDAAAGVFVTLNPPTKSMLTEAVKAGDFGVEWFPRRFVKIQILTIVDILEGKRVEFPESLDVTFNEGKTC